MVCLGIESTAHTFGIGIVSFDGKILANEKAMFTTVEGGMIPNLVAEHHKKVCDEILKTALEKAKISLKDIKLISYSRGPGISPCLFVGFNFAKNLSTENNIPLIGINHCVAHLTIGNLTTKAKNPVYLYVSGVNTQLISLENGLFRIFGETLDIGLGNALDKLGRILGLGFPAGPKIEQLAKDGKYVELPYTVKGMDVSFSGIITKAEQLAKKHSKEDICYSIQETCFSMLAEISERALAHVGKKELLLIGGVAANKRLCKILEIMCNDRGAEFYAVPIEYSGDQGAMIAWQGILEHKAGKKFEGDICPYERTDEVKVDFKTFL